MDPMESHVDTPGQLESRPQPRRLTRSIDDRMFAGVCGGVAEYCDVDPTLVRVAAVLATVLSVGGVPIAYLVAWAIMPEAR